MASSYFQVREATIILQHQKLPIIISFGQEREEKEKEVLVFMYWCEIWACLPYTNHHSFKVGLVLSLWKVGSNFNLLGVIQTYPKLQPLHSWMAISHVDFDPICVSYFDNVGKFEWNNIEIW